MPQSPGKLNKGVWPMESAANDLPQSVQVRRSGCEEEYHSATREFNREYAAPAMRRG
jgi:hypothetical protein